MKARLWKWLRRGLLALVAGAVLALLFFFSLPWLVIGPAETAPVDVILHFSIDERYDTDSYVAELYQRGLAREIVCLSSQVAWRVYPADYARQHLIQLGVPAQHVHTLYLPPVECRAQATPLVIAFLKQRGWQSAMMVIDPSISRVTRSRAISAYAREQIKLWVTYSPRDYKTLTDQWWREHWKTQRLTGEVLEAGFDLFYPECR
jgi:hypothetical protein